MLKYIIDLPYAKEKKIPERRNIRLQNGKQWLKDYTGAPEHLRKSYCKYFHVDAVTAVEDLIALGVDITQEQLEQIKRAEEKRVRRRQRILEDKKRKRVDDLYDDCDGNFGYIAEYTGAECHMA